MYRIKSIVKTNVISLLILVSLLFVSIVPAFKIQAFAAGSGAGAPKSTVPKLHVEGHNIVDESNNPVQLRGFCCGTSTRIDRQWPVWYTNQTFVTIKSWNTNLFRITLKPEQYEWKVEYVDVISKYADMAIDNGMYVLFTWMGNDDFMNYETSAGKFFDALSKRYSGCNNVIYEVCNEPFHAHWGTLYDYGVKMINIIRKNSPDAIVGLPAPYHILATDDNMTSIISKPLPFNNVVYTHHMYVASSFSSSVLREMDEIMDNDLCVFISEWGTTHSNGRDGFDGERSRTWMEYLDARGVSWVNFNLSDVYWNDTPYNSSVVKMGEWNPELTDDILSESGYFMKHYFLNDLEEETGGSSEMMGYSKDYAFWDNRYKTSITRVVFAESGFAPSNPKQVWDCSVITGTNKVMAYLCEEGKDKVLYISAKEGKLTAPLIMSSFFEGFSALKSVDFSGLDTSNTTNVSRLFFNCKSLTDIEWGDNVFNNAANWSQSFALCKGLKDLDLTDLDMDNANNINLMFSWCDHLEELSLPYLYEDDINESSDVFYKCSINTDSLLVKMYDDNSIYVSELLENSTALNEDYLLEEAFSSEDIPDRSSGESSEKTADSSGEIMEAVQGQALWSDENKNEVTRVVFVDQEEAPSTFKKVWDCSASEGAREVKAYLCPEDIDTTLYIAASDGTVTAPESLSGYFDGFTSLRTADLSSLDASDTTNASKMFNNCKSLEYIDWGDNSFENVENWSQAFGACKKLTELDLTGFDMDAVKNINLMFCWCDRLEYLGLPYLTEDNLSAIKDVFYKCGINADTLTIENIKHNNDFIHELLRNSTHVNQSYVLKNAAETDESANNDAKIVSLVDVPLEEITEEPVSLAKEDEIQTTVEETKVSEETKKDETKEEEEPVVLAQTEEVVEESVPQNVSPDMMNVSNGYAFWKNDVKTTIHKVVFSDEAFVPEDSIEVWDVSAESDSKAVMAYLCNESGDKTLYITSASGEINAPESMAGFFEGFTALKSVDLSGLQASETTNLSKLFYNCKVLEDINFGKNTFENVTNWSQAFAACKALTEIDLSEIDMGNANNISLMFSWCNHVENINLPYIYQEQLSNPKDVFYKVGINAGSLNVDAYKENTMLVNSLLENSTDPNPDYTVTSKGSYKVITMLAQLDGPIKILGASNGYAFWQDEFKSSITKVVFAEDGFIPDDPTEEWDVSSNPDTYLVMAYLCDEDDDRTLYISSEYGEINAPESMAGYFEGFKALKMVDLSGLNASDTTDVSNLFYNCQSLEEINFGPNSFGSVDNWSQAFAVCKGLTELNLSDLDFGNVSNINLMFSWCNHLENLKLPYLDEGNISSAKDVFYKTGVNTHSWVIEVPSDNFEFVRGLIDESTGVNTSYEMPGYEEVVEETDVEEYENDQEPQEVDEIQFDTDTEIVEVETETEEVIIDIEEDDPALADKPYDDNPVIPITVVLCILVVVILANKPEYIKKLISYIRSKI